VKFQLTFQRACAHAAAREEEEGFVGRREGRAIVKWGGEQADEAFVKAVQIKERTLSRRTPAAEHLARRMLTVPPKTWPRPRRDEGLTWSATCQRGSLWPREPSYLRTTTTSMQIAPAREARTPPVRSTMMPRSPKDGSPDSSSARRSSARRRWRAWYQGGSNAGEGGARRPPTPPATITDAGLEGGGAA
jgi:hypothetical protein